MGLMQVLAATGAPPRFATDRLNIRYFTDATQDAVEVTAATADDLRASSAPYATAAAGSRRLTHAAESLQRTTDHMPEDVATGQLPADVAAEHVHLTPGRSDGHTGVRALPGSRRIGGAPV